MQSRNFVSFTLSLVLIYLAVSSADSNVTSTNATTSGATVVQTTTIPTTTVTSAKPSDASSQQKATNTTGKPATTGDDDCSDEEPAAEPEGAATNGTDRQGKQLTLNDKDKYTHEGGKAEPEPESEPNSNSTSATGKLTGNSTTARPATGGASSIFSGFTFGLGTLAAAILYMRADSTNL